MPQSIMITGWGQVTQPKQALPPCLDPLDMMERAARDAAALAGVGVLASLASIDTRLVVRAQSRVLRAPGEELARGLGLRPRHIEVSGIGGQVPQQFVNRAAGMLARGEAGTVLVVGAETYYPRTVDAVRGEQTLIQGISDDYDEADAVGSNALEQRHGLSLPIHGFPLFEVALWAQSGSRREHSGWRASAACGRASARSQPTIPTCGRARHSVRVPSRHRPPTTVRSACPIPSAWCRWSWPTSARRSFSPLPSAAATRGLRFIANTRGDSASFTALIDTNPVGSTVRLHHDGNVNIAELNI